MLGTSLSSHAVGCSYSYETLGEIRSCLMHGALVLYLPAIIVYWCGYPARAAAINLMLALLLATPQLLLARRQSIVRNEVERIVKFAEDARQETGHYPQGLTTYVWKRPSCRHFIDYDLTDNEHLMIYFWSGNRSAPHWYSCTSSWGYYPD
jgi:hypothetical protein